MDYGNGLRHDLRTSDSVHVLGLSGRSSPFHNQKGSISSRSGSPHNAKAPFSIKRPPSALRNHDLNNKRNFNEQAATDNRPASALSNRSTNVIKGTSVGAVNTVVSVRIRPLATKAIQQPWLCQDGVTIRTSHNTQGAALEFTFDHVFDQEHDNHEIYKKSVKRLVDAVVDGYHGTVFAYGMTGTGKTYSMQGTSTEVGIIPLAVRDLIRLSAQSRDKKYVLKVSYLEIYNERIRDLLNESFEVSEEIKIRNDPKRGIHAYPLKEFTIASEDDFMSLMAQGEAVRHSAATDFNTHSSRSHAVIQLIVESRARSDAGHESRWEPVRVSTLNLIDLAGSERAATDAERRKEGAYINKSLLTLGSVISRLTAPMQYNATTHVPFRDSRLTRLLQDALSGFSLVSILATINNDSRFVLETTNTLKFAARAKNIPGRAQKAEISNGDSVVLIESLKTEIADLGAQLRASQALVARLKSGLPSQPTDVETEDEQHPGTKFFSLDTAETDKRTEILRRRIITLESEKKESEHYIASLQARLLNNQKASMPQQSLSPKPQMTTTQDALSYPLNYDPAQTNTQMIAVNKSSMIYQEQSDKDNAIADQALANNVLYKSQRSREEARNLTQQIAQLKLREIAKSSVVDGLVDATIAKHQLCTARDKENKCATELTETARYTIISPNIRAPREGFI